MRNPAKFDRCVRAVRARGGGVNPYAVCTAGLAGLGVEDYRTPPIYPETPPYLARTGEELPLWRDTPAWDVLRADTLLRTLITPPRVAAAPEGGEDWAAMLDRYKWPLAGALVFGALLLRGR